MTSLEIIKDELERINKVRNSTAFVPKEKWSLEDDSKTIDCPECGNEVESQGYVIKSADKYQAVDIHLYGMEKICKPQAQFIAMAANEITKLTKALSVAVETLQTMNHLEVQFKAQGGVYNPKLGCVKHETIWDVTTKPSEDALKTIANILSGGEDGNL